MDGELSAFLHLDMDHLGSTDISVKMKGTAVKTNFYMADDAHQLMLAVKYSKQADIFVVKGDMQNIFDYGIEAYAFREKIEGKAFNINCLPTVFTQKDYTFVVNEYLLNDESENKEKSND
jgi:hypothetical protein